MRCLCYFYSTYVVLTIEHLSDGSDDCPLIRLFDFESADVIALHAVCLALAEQRVSEVSLDSQPWVRAIGDCRLTLRAGPANRRVRIPPNGQPFILEQDAEAWREVSDKLAPLVADQSSFQWLTTQGDVKLLISRTGRW